MKYLPASKAAKPRPQMGLPITLGTEFKFNVKLENLIPVILPSRAALTVKVEFMPYAELNLKIIKFRLTIVRKTIMNNELVL